MPWRVAHPCADCPFRRDGKGFAVRFGRLREIAEGALLGQPFHCHKTVYGPRIERRPRARWVECAGVIEWRDRVLKRWPSLASHVLRKLVAAVERDAADRRAARRRTGRR